MTTTVDTKLELEKDIPCRNQRHFRQAQHRPWYQPPLYHINSDNNFNLDSVTNNNLKECSSLTETRMVLAILQDEFSKNHPKWIPFITFEDFISGILHWKEKTTTSPSGRHLGVYRSLFTAYIDAGNEFSAIIPPQSLSTKTKATMILKIIHGLLSKACIKGFYLKRWVQVVEIMMYKKLEVSR